MSRLTSLIEALEAEDELDRVRAAHALRDLADVRAFEPLRRMLDAATSPQLRDAAAVALGDLGDVRAIPPLRRQLWLPENALNRGTIVGALGTLKAASAALDFARLMCEAAYEPAQRALMGIEGVGASLDPETRARALALIEHRLHEPMDNDWRADLLDEAEDLLRSQDDPRASGGD
jgi:HEAT repeat protein